LSTTFKVHPYRIIWDLEKKTDRNEEPAATKHLTKQTQNQKDEGSRTAGPLKQHEQQLLLQPKSIDCNE
jgi:hypothetical protein